MCIDKKKYPVSLWCLYFGKKHKSPPQVNKNHTWLFIIPSQKSQTEAMGSASLRLTVFFCNSVTRWISPGTRAWLQSIAPRLRSGQWGHCFPWKSFVGFCIHARISASWKTTPNLYTSYRSCMSPITEPICPKSSHIHIYIYMHERLRV